MAIQINGTTGISGVDGSASAPALQGTDSNTGINFASDTVNINTGGVTRATVDSSGRVIVGSTSHIGGAQFVVMGGNLNNYGAMAIGNKATNPTSGTSIAQFRFNSGATGTRRGAEIIVQADNNWTDGSSHPTRMIFSTAASNATSATERMRIDSSGHIGFGPHGIDPSSNGGITMRQTVISGTNKGAVISNNTIDSGQGFQEFRSSGTQIGSIGKSGTTSTTYNTSSDYRLKENESPITDGITRLKILKPYRFNWKADASTKVDGFFAHEVTPAVPEAITGAKDAVDSDNNPINQQIDQSKLVPLLTAALQEAIAKIEVLETENTQMKTDLTALTARVTALEAG